MAVIELRPGQVFAGYRIEELAGHGGMGIVYRATQLLLDRAVALKLIVPALVDDPAFHERFQREWRLLALIDHPHVIPAYEAGEVDGRLFVSMRWVQGPNLAEMLTGTVGLELARAVAIVGQVAAALEAVHGSGLVHRDVKPANVLIEARGERDHAFLSDLGITKRIDAGDSITATGGWMGTLDYAAPEQLAAGPLDARTDIYSLGCVLFEALTGRVPYPRDSPMAKLSAHLHDPVPSASDLHPGIPPTMDAVIARAMAKDPAARYPTAGDLARAAASATSTPHPHKRALASDGRRTKRARGPRGNTPAAMPLHDQSLADIAAAADAAELPPPGRAEGKPDRDDTFPDGARPTGQLWQWAKHGWNRVRHNPVWTAVTAVAVGAVVAAALAVFDGPESQSATVPSGPVPPNAKTWREQAHHPARTFKNPHTLQGEAQSVRPNHHVQVLCKIYWPNPPSVVPEGYWYRITSKPWAGSYYAPANSFWNGDVPGKKPYTRATDRAVPNC
jgi:serine/threonine protein kinase